jgi:hypothetical protein
VCKPTDDTEEKIANFFDFLLDIDYTEKVSRWFEMLVQGEFVQIQEAVALVKVED